MTSYTSSPSSSPPAAPLRPQNLHRWSRSWEAAKHCVDLDIPPTSAASFASSRCHRRPQAVASHQRPWVSLLLRFPSPSPSISSGIAGLRDTGLASTWTPPCRARLRAAPLPIHPRTPPKQEKPVIHVVRTLLHPHTCTETPPGSGYHRLKLAIAATCPNCDLLSVSSVNEA